LKKDQKKLNFLNHQKNRLSIQLNQDFANAQSCHNDLQQFEASLNLGGHITQMPPPRQALSPDKKMLASHHRSH